LSSNNLGSFLLKQDRSLTLTQEVPPPDCLPPSAVSPFTPPIDLSLQGKSLSTYLQHTHWPQLFAQAVNYAPKHGMIYIANV